MKKTDLITLIIKGADLSYKKEIDKTIASKILAICLASDGKQEPNGNSGQVLEIDKPSGESLVEFLNHHAPKRNPDKILTLAGYLKQERGQSSFTFEEVKRLFRDAGEIFPGNFSRDCRWTIRTGWIASEPGKKGVFYITNSGLQVLKSKFAKELTDRTGINTMVRRKKVRTRKISKV